MSQPFRVLSLGAGVDSTTLLLLSEHGYLPRLDAAIFADTQAEPQAVYETIEWLTAAVTIPVYRVTAGNLMSDTVARVGDGLPGGKFTSLPFWVTSPHRRGGRLRRECTEDYKIVPIRRKLRELLGLSARMRAPKTLRVEQWLGFTIDDMGRTFCSDVKWISNVFPLIVPLQMHRRDCVRWLESHGYRVPQKSSCTFCPYHSNAYWRDMRDNRPAEWQQTVALEHQLHQGKLPGVKGVPYLHRSLMPLDQAPIDVIDTGQQELFCYTCNT